MVVTTNKKIKIINNKNRSILSEGRSNGLCFAFCKATEDSVYETIQPISACKDYLNDIIYNERTGKPISAYGLSCTSPTNIFVNKYAYLVIQVLNDSYQQDNLTKQLIAMQTKLQENYQNLTLFMNYIEEMLGVNIGVYETCINKTENDTQFLVSFSSDFWCKYTYTISLYALLLRVGIWFDPDKYTDSITYLEEFNHYQPDVMLVKQCLPKLKYMIEYGLPIQELDKMQGNSSTHNCGINTFQFPVVNKPILEVV